MTVLVILYGLIQLLTMVSLQLTNANPLLFFYFLIFSFVFDITIYLIKVVKYCLLIIFSKNAFHFQVTVLQQP